MRALLPARSRRGHLGDVMAQLSRLQPTGSTDLPGCLTQIAAMLKHHSLVMVFSDLLPGASDDDPQETIRHWHGCATEAMTSLSFMSWIKPRWNFPTTGPVQFQDSESGEMITVDATGFREDYLAQLDQFRETYRAGCSQLRIDYVPLDTSMPFDKALTEYLIQRKNQFRW